MRWKCMYLFHLAQSTDQWWIKALMNHKLPLNVENFLTSEF